MDTKTTITRCKTPEMTWNLTLKEQMASQYSKDQDKDVCFHPAFFNIVLGVPRQAIRQKNEALRLERKRQN